DLGLRVTINTDDPTVSNINLTDEYEIATTMLGQGYLDLRQMVLNAAEAAFLPEDGRKRLVAYFQKQLPLL
ncbi:MAG: adenosine deaminase, partial [Anaerolineae bacterium]